LSRDPRELAVVEIGGTSVKFGFAQGREPLTFTCVVPTTDIQCVDPVGALAFNLLRATKGARIEPARVVVTVPGFIDRDFDHVLSAANVPELNGIALASELQARIGIPVRLERDVVLQLLGESFAGAVRDETHVLAVYFGTGIGAAYLGEDTIFRGGGWALEIGHIPMHGLGRTLPGIGCDRAEVYASGRTLAAIAAKHNVDVARVFTARKRNQDLSRELRAIVRDQAFVIASGIALLSPRIVLVGGGIVQMADYPREELRAVVADHLPLPPMISPLDLRWAQLGWEAAIWGALSQAARSFH
jgi:allose kinase